MKIRERLLILAVLSLIVLCAPLAFADYVYDEAVDGDLPHPNWATVLPFGAPSPNLITFTVDANSDGWIIEIGPGETMESFTLVDYAPNDPAYSATFHVHDGTSTTDPKIGTANYSSFGYDMLNVDFFAHFEMGHLGEGSYLFNFWGDNSLDPTMTFDINITNGSVPTDETSFGGIKALFR